MAQILTNSTATLTAGTGSALPQSAPTISMPKQAQGTAIMVSPSNGINKPAQQQPGSNPSPIPGIIPAGIVPPAANTPGSHGGVQGVPGLLPISSTMSNGAVGPISIKSQQPVGTELENGVEHLNKVLSPTLNQQTLANTKEKTPMCLINELARFNKIQHQYTLTDEQGPAHKKTFYVKLKLGEEEYSSSGPSIKKAQHAAAAIALEKTQYKHPPPKALYQGYEGEQEDLDNESITPTVELNALVMKRGEPAIYRPIEMPRPQYYPPPNLDFRGMYNQRYHYPRFPRVFYVSLKVGQREFIGEGSTRQSARHNAAAKSLKVLRNLPLPNEDSKVETVLTAASEEEDDDGEGGDAKDALKSEISLVHEIALKRNLPVNFEVTRESGPPHMRTFVTRCSVGDLVTEGEGNGKKVSKKRAAEKMLEELKTLPSMPPSIARAKRNIGNKKKNRNLIKVSPALQKADPSYGVGINPISRLIQIQQAKKEKEPIYTLVAERGMPRRREFVMQVQVGDHTCTGVGPNKKLAKRSAAEAMLQLLGYSRPSPQPSKPAIKSGGEGPMAADKKVTFLDPDGNPSRQLVPGVLLMPEGRRALSMHSGIGYSSGDQAGLNRAPGSPLQSHGTTNNSPQTTAAIAKELLDTGSSPTAEALCKSNPNMGTGPAAVGVKEQLLYLADVLGFQVQFTDFPKGTNKNEFLSLVSLSTNPPQVSHGAGPTIEDSHDIAALTALKSLAELAIGNFTDSMKKEDKMAAGDGPHVKSDGVDGLANSKDLGCNTIIKTETN